MDTANTFSMFTKLQRADSCKANATAASMDSNINTTKRAARARGQATLALLFGPPVFDRGARPRSRQGLYLTARDIHGKHLLQLVALIE